MRTPATPHSANNQNKCLSPAGHHSYHTPSLTPTWSACRTKIFCAGTNSCGRSHVYGDCSNMSVCAHSLAVQAASFSSGKGINDRLDASSSSQYGRTDLHKPPRVVC